MDMSLVIFIFRDKWSDLGKGELHLLHLDTKYKTV